jgi:predicted ribosomally synthesized peptide with nif11-like leader
MAMSKSEVERFIADMKTSAILQAAVKSKTVNIQSLAAIASAHGYDFTGEDVLAHIKARKPELTERELDAAVGGVYFQFGGGSFNFGIKP